MARLVGSSLIALRRAQDIRAKNQVRKPRGGDALSFSPSTTPGSLNTVVGGTGYSVFIPGVHNPDDTHVVRWVL